MAAETDEREAAAAEDEKRFERLSASRIYFARMPKPAELATTTSREKEKDALDEKLRAVGAELQPVMADRSRNSAHLAEAREAVRELKAQIDDKQLILNPYQQGKKAVAQDRETQRKTREEQRQAERKAREESYRAELGAKQKIRNDFASQYGHLSVSTEDEVEEKLRALEFSQQHESLTISEEKAVIKQIRQLQDAREAVRTYSQWVTEDKAEREARAAQAKRRKDEKLGQPQQAKPRQEAAAGGEAAEDPQKEEMDELKQVVDGLWEDYKMQLDIKNKHQEIDAGLKQTIEALFEKRDALRKERDEVWSKIQKRREEVRSANKPFAENRNFSARVRELVKLGKASEARQLCAEQTTALMDRYASDTAFRQEYNALWDATVDYSRPATSASEGHHTAAASVIAEALEAARRSVANKQAAKSKQAEAKPPETKKPAPLTGEEAAPSAAPAAAFPVPKPTIPGMEASERPKAKAKKEKKAAKIPAVEVPVVDDTPFVPPVMASGKSATVQSAEELKEQERAHNRAAAAEAAQRKERRRIAQEKKRQKAQKLEAAPKQSLLDTAEDISPPDTPPAEEVAPGNAAPSQQTAAAAADELRSRAKPARTAKRAPGLRPRPPTKKSFYGTLRLYSRRIYSAAEEHPIAVGVSSLAAVVLAFAPAVYFYSQ